MLVLDGAGWHSSKILNIPENFSLMPLPPYSPELNPVENVRHPHMPGVCRRAKLSENCRLWNRHKRRRPPSRIPLRSANLRCGWLWNTAMRIRARLRR